MGHLTVRSAYRTLVERINLFPQGAPQSEVLYKILSMLFSEEEARFVSDLSIKPFTIRQAALLTKTTITEAQKTLERLAEKGLLLDTEIKGTVYYVLPPPMAGFFEFALMRLRNDIDQKLLSELYYQYLNVEEDFIRDLFYVGDTKLGRTFVNETALKNSNIIEIMDYERATEVIKTASHIGVGLCYCRHKMEHMGKACSAPMDICMTFNNVASSLIGHKIARQVDVIEGLDLLQQAYENNLVQLGDNVKENVSFICNCCKCCCEALVAARNFGFLNPVETTNYLPEVNVEKCNGCGKCINACPVEALELITIKSREGKRLKKALLNQSLCLGCGLCVKSCKFGAIELIRRKQRIITPVNSVHRVVLMAIERGKLQNLIFDKHALWNHRAMAAILGVILRLPPVRQALASKQMKSRYLEFLIKKFS